MEGLSDGGVLEGEAQIINLIGGDDLSMVEATMLQNDGGVGVMMELVGGDDDDDDPLSAAFSSAFPPPPATSSIITTAPSTSHRPTPLPTSSPGAYISSSFVTAPSSGANVSPPLFASLISAAQVPVSPGRSQGNNNNNNFTVGGNGFSPYLSPTPLPQTSHTNPLHESQTQYLPQVKSEPSPVDVYLPELKDEPQDEFIEAMESHTEPSHTPTTPYTTRGMVAIPFPHHAPPPPPPPPPSSVPSPGGLTTIEGNGAPSPSPQYIYPTGQHPSTPYLLELAPLPLRPHHQQQQQHQQQHQQQQQQHNSQVPPPHPTPSPHNNNNNNNNNTNNTRLTNNTFGSELGGYYETATVPQEDNRQVVPSQVAAHMMYLPPSHHVTIKSRLKGTCKESSPCSPTLQTDDNDESGTKAGDHNSNDSDDDNLIIDTSSGGGGGGGGGGSDGFECGECGLVCRTRGGLRKHLTAEHLPDEPEPAETIPKQYQCTMPLCHFTTTKRDAYDLHMASHIADGWTPTGKKRQNKNPLQRHRYNKEELTCPLCDYACTVEKAFRRHLKTHETGFRGPISKISCCICGKDRPSEGEMKKHMKKHRCGKYYRCDICKFQTVQLKKLIQHRRMHTGEKPHLCPFCPYRAARRDNLRSHVRRMHKRENMYGDTFTPRPVLLAEADCQEHDFCVSVPCLDNIVSNSTSGLQVL
ncbi:hypothetical protein Pcinc_035930 [Petrolisthes cinctipes]|uniref:C2H2-type domain-containing protein n=1 Tax=Petrolisthes cinctipes TaxID=88211 RepID=A0AAE1BVZ0_PETCI|nr:hypothetical protein Pcinc_035930 [Petrolisthes cinctipes]